MAKAAAVTFIHSDSEPSSSSRRSVIGVTGDGTCAGTCTVDTSVEVDKTIMKSADMMAANTKGREEGKITSAPMPVPLPLPLPFPLSLQRLTMIEECDNMIETSRAYRIPCCRC